MWIRQIPTEVGNYWYYGYTDRFDRQRGQKRLLFVSVRKIANGFAYVANGAFYYPGSPNEPMDGHWLVIEPPDIPEEE
jgi:hypothetical protein